MQPEISVCLLTYNHKDYIEQSIDSILQQEFDGYELIIGEDCSGDGTREICLEYQKKFPDLITVVLNDRENVSTIQGKPTHLRNFISIVTRARGKYIALMSGDDYWIDKRKLQKQYDALENNPDCSLCFTDAWYGMNGGVTETNFFKYNFPEKVSFDFLLREKLFIPAISILFRKEVLPDPIPEWFRHILHEDIMTYAFASKYGLFYCINDKTCVYRRHDTNITLTTKELLSLETTLYEMSQLKDIIDDRLFIRQSIAELSLKIAVFYLRELKVLPALKYLRISLSSKPLLSIKYYRDMFYLLRTKHGT